MFSIPVGQEHTYAKTSQHAAETCRDCSQQVSKIEIRYDFVGELKQQIQPLFGDLVLSWVLQGLRARRGKGIHIKGPPYANCRIGPTQVYARCRTLRHLGLERRRLAALYLLPSMALIANPNSVIWAGM
jgi:hypothetical protein